MPTNSWGKKQIMPKFRILNWKIRLHQWQGLKCKDLILKLWDYKWGIETNIYNYINIVPFRINHQTV